MLKDKKLLKAAFTAGYLLLAALLFLTNKRIVPAPSVLLFLGVLSLASAQCFARAADRADMRVYLTRRLPACLLVSAYASFASFGYRLFLDSVRISVSAKGAAYLALGALWFFPIVISILYLLEETGERSLLRSGGTDKGRLYTQIACGAACFACLLVGLIAFYPGAYPIDSLQQFSQARGTFILRDAHPVMHTMIIRLLLSIWDNEMFVVIFQMACFAVVVGRACGIVYRCGVPGWLIFAGTVIFSLLPNQIMFHICPLKDVLFTSAMIWGTLLLIDLAMDVACIRRPLYWIQLVFSMLMIATIRHNGAMPAAMMAALLLILTLKYYRQVKLYAAAAAVAFVALMGLWKGPALDLLGAQPNDATPYMTMFCAVGSVINKGGTLSEESMKKLESVMPLEDWAAYYSRFSGHDDYMFVRPGGMDLTGFSAAEAFSIYLDAFTRYPDIVIKDRLDGANLLWDVTQPADSFNAKGFDYMLIADSAGFQMPGIESGGYYESASPLASLYRRLTDFAVPREEEHRQLTNMLLWRPGAYLIFLMVLAIYWRRHALWRMRWIALPLLGNTLLWVVGLYYQAFRYVYYIQVLTIVLTAATFVMLRAKKCTE